MTKLKILGRKGHEEFVDLTPEEATKLIEEVESAEGERYFIVDQKTQKILKELKITDDQELVMIPIIRGG